MAASKLTVDSFNHLTSRDVDQRPSLPHEQHHENGSKLRLAGIIVGAIAGVLFLSIIIFFIVKRFRKPKQKSTLPQHLTIKSRSLSGISDDDPDGIKPVKRLRSFHMKGATSPSPQTPSKQGVGVFSKLFNRKNTNEFGSGNEKFGGRGLGRLDEESRFVTLPGRSSRDDYERFSRYPDTPGLLDEKLLEASPPPTPPHEFAWNADSRSGKRLGHSRGSPESNTASISSDIGEHNIAYKGDRKAPAGQNENDGFLDRKSQDKKRLSEAWDENFQTKPSNPRLYDDDSDDERNPLAYNPDSRSGH